MTRVLDIKGLEAFYGDFQALFGVDLHLDAGETLAIIGANGAGKSTLLRSISGVIANRADAIVLGGQPIGHLPSHRVAHLGISMVPEGRRLFPSLSVEENLKCGGDAFSGGGARDLRKIYELFPVLAERRKVAATSLSGGQQQMVAIGRALLSNPKILLCDEISLGLAPVIIRDIYAAMPKIRAGGVSVIVVEQDIGQALAVADRVCCMMEGRITLEGKPENLDREAIHAAYFGDMS
jgi:branched-chain amino acid transport system ATP-binding protein